MSDLAQKRDMIGKRLLVINPNTNAAVTSRVREAVQAAVSPGTVPVVVNPTHGPFAIETSADRAIAAPIVLDLIRSSSEYDGYVLACFDDFAVAEARQVVSAPIFSMAEAGILRALSHGVRFTIVTTVADAVLGIESMLQRYGAAGWGSVRAAGIGVAEASAQTSWAEMRLGQTIQDAVSRDGARCIVLGSGAFTGRAAALEARFGVYFVDGLSAAITLVEGSPPVGQREHVRARAKGTPV